MGTAEADSVRLYLTEIGRYPLLSAAEEVELSRRIQAGLHLEGVPENELSESDRRLLTDSRRAKQRLVQCNLRLVVSIAKKYQNRGLSLQDLIQEGSTGLVRAAEKFDPARGYKFSTYSFHWVRQAVTRSIASNTRSIRLPVHVVESLNKIKKHRAKFTSENGRQPSLSELATLTGLKVEKIKDVLESAYRVSVVGLDTKRPDEQSTLLDILECSNDGYLTAENDVHLEQLRSRLEKLFTHLTPREKQVIYLKVAEGKTLEEIGKLYDLSRERIRQVFNKGMRKLKSRSHELMRDRFLA